MEKSKVCPACRGREQSCWRRNHIWNRGVLIVSIKVLVQDFTLNLVFRKLWFFVFVATYFWIKSKILDTCLCNFYHLFYVTISIFLDMESTLAKKITTNFFKKYFGIFLFILFLIFFQSCYLIFHFQNFATHCKKANKKRIITIR